MVVSDSVANEVRAKLHKAEEFLLIAHAAEGCHDSVTSLAVSATINAADVILLAESESYPRGEDHGQAVARLRAIGRERAARHLRAALGLKNKAQYDAQRCSEAEAREALKHAERLLDQATDEAARKGISK